MIDHTSISHFIYSNVFQLFSKLIWALREAIGDLLFFWNFEGVYSLSDRFDRLNDWGSYTILLVILGVKLVEIWVFNFSGDSGSELGEESSLNLNVFYL